MILARRKFLKSSLFFGASAALVLVSDPLGLNRNALADDGGIPIQVLEDPVYSFTSETFKPYVGGYFQAPNARGEMVALKLLEVRTYKPHQKTKITTSSIETESFSLLFRADEPLPLFTSIHKIQHGALGEFDLSLIPRTGEEGQFLYESIFNHLRVAAQCVGLRKSDRRGAGK